MSRVARRTPERLADDIRELRYYGGGDPFDLVIAGSMRALGIPVRDKAPEGELAGEVHELVQGYVDLVNADEPFMDILGPVYMHYTEGKKAFAGQFFTPWDLCLFIAAANLGNWEPGPPPDGELWSVLEPACGSGGMLLAFFQLILRRHGPEALDMWRAVMWDIDLTVARAAAIQFVATLARYGWGLGEIKVIHGNALSLEVHSVVLHATAKPRAERNLSILPADSPTSARSQFDLFLEPALAEVWS